MGYGRHLWRRTRPWKSKRPPRRSWRARKVRLIARFAGVRWRDGRGVDDPRWER